MIEKECGRCKQVKTLDQFYKSSQTKSGYRCYCKMCKKQLNQENKDEISTWQKAYRVKNEETLLEKKKLYYENNKEELLRKQKIYRDENRDEINARAKARRDGLSPEDNARRLKKQREYYKNNPDYFKGPRVKFSSYKAGAKSRKHEFAITLEEFESFWQEPCFYCGGEINTIGLDRVDNTVGYKMNNIKSCCTQCNTAKRASSIREWISWIEKLKNQTHSRNKTLEGIKNAE